MAWTVREGGVEYPTDLRLPLQPFGDLERALHVALEPDIDSS